MIFIPERSESHASFSKAKTHTAKLQILIELHSPHTFMKFMEMSISCAVLMSSDLVAVYSWEALRLRSLMQPMKQLLKRLSQTRMVAHRTSVSSLNALNAELQWSLTVCSLTKHIRSTSTALTQSMTSLIRPIAWSSLGQLSPQIWQRRRWHHF